MDRRDFIKLAGSVGLGVVAGSSIAGHAKSDEPFKGPYWMMFNASGGWDVTSLCDPKGAISATELDTGNPMNQYLASDIETHGLFKCPPAAAFPGVSAFFEKHQSQLMVINGIDFATNSHDAGSRIAWSGTLTENKPAFAALVAGTYAPTQPMSFITYGGYDISAGVVAVTRAGDPDTLRKIAFPSIINPGAPAEEQQGFHSQGAQDILTKFRDERLLEMQAKQQLPRLNEKLGLLYMARTGQNQLKKLVEYLPSPDDQLQGLAGQAQIAIAAMRAGVCVAANLSAGGFDTHGDNDAGQNQALTRLLEGLSAAHDEAQLYPETQNNVRFMAAGDFGRTPRYNMGNGKDHWSISSMLMMGPGIPNKLVGQTDEEHNPMGINPQTLEAQANGMRLTPGHIHRALRKLAGIDTNPLMAKFPLKEPEDMPIFG
jgi:uncharacterized protein (DUF1501 family)